MSRTFAIQRARAAVIVVLVGAVAVPLVITSPFWQRVLVLSLVFVILASGLNLLVGFTGLLDLGYIAFFTVGAYFAAILTAKVAIGDWGLRPSQIWWAIVPELFFAGGLAAIVGLVLGYPTLRARGDYLAIMTLAFGEVIRLLAVNMSWLTNGALGIPNIPPVQVGSSVLVKPWQLYYLALGLAVFSIFLISRLIRSGVGRAWVAIREDETVAATMGIHTTKMKLYAYSSGAFFGGLVGVFYAHLQQYINPDSFALQNNLLVLSLIIVGGSGTLWGPVLGAVLWIVFQQWAQQQSLLQVHPELLYIVMGAVVLLVLIVMPRGLIQRRPRLTSVSPSPATDDLLAAPSVVVVGDATPALGQEVLRVVGLTCRFGGLVALSEIDLSLSSGEIFGIIGPNGAGKSTLFNVISGLQPVQEGDVAVCGSLIRGLGASDVASLGLARTFQNIRLFGEMTVLENALVGAHRRVPNTPMKVLVGRGVRQADAVAQREAEAMLAYVGVHELRDREAQTLSYGDQRRVEIARALMTHPSILMLDEPAAGMNETETAALATLIEQIRQDGVSVVLIEHDIDFVMRVADRLAVLDNGRKIADGIPGVVQRDEQVVAAYLGVEA